MNLKDLTTTLHHIQAIKFGSFVLKSGIISPIYIDLRLLISYPKLLQQVAAAMWEKIKGSSFDLVCGVPYTALPIATCFSVAQQIPMVMRRKEVKDHGTKKAIEGAFKKGQTCLVIEDLITTGSSIMETVEPLQQEGLVVRDAIVLIDREQGGKQALEKRGLQVHALMNLTEMLKTLRDEKKIDATIYEATLEFLGQGAVYAS